MVRHRQTDGQTQTDRWSDTDRQMIRHRQTNGQTQTDRQMVRHRQMRWSDTDR